MKLAELRDALSALLEDLAQAGMVDPRDVDQILMRLGEVAKSLNQYADDLEYILSDEDE